MGSPRNLTRFYALREASGGAPFPGGFDGAVAMQRETKAMRDEGLVGGNGPYFGLTSKGKQAWTEVEHG